MIYIHKQIGFWNLESILPDSYRKGASLEDYESGAYLLLDAEQERFHVDHPDASQVECWNKKIASKQEQIPESVPDKVEIARQWKLCEIEAQDGFSNKFFISVIQGGREIANRELWLDKNLRNSLYSITLPALQANGETNTRLWTDTTPPQPIEVPVAWAMEKLPLLEVYAKRTYDLRAGNEAAVYAATTVEEIQAIDVKAGYPPFLTFELNLDLTGV